MWSYTFITCLLSPYLVSALPADAWNLLTTSPSKERAASGPSSTPPQGNGYLPLVPPPFDAALQYISTSGYHKFIPPGPSDARGPCPGLNALANHGYLPRNGLATAVQMTTACKDVYGMALDLGGFLAVFGAVLDGSLTGFSLLGLPHTGIGGSHNNYETDSSAFKGDLDQYGTNTDLVLSQFKRLYNMQPNVATANYNLEILSQYRASRFQESVAKNPYFFFGPFSGQQVGTAGFVFQYRLFGNKSAEYPAGTLNQEVLKSFASVTGSGNNLKWTRGHERIPDNWYKRHPLDEFTIPFLETDIIHFATIEPRILTVGCNEGRVNSYDAIDPALLTSGAYTTQQALKNPACFATQFAIAELPGLTGLPSAVLAPLISQLTGATAGMNCAGIGTVNTSALFACPGFSNYGGPTGPIAPGAIQS